MSDPAVLASVWRGTAPEAIVRGHIVVVDRDGTVIESAGDPECLTTLRSAVKPVQALPFAAVAADIGARDDELAVACGSHIAEPVHVATVRRLLARVGLDDASLQCGSQLPGDRLEAARRTLSGDALRAVDNNCSGKHAGMLAACIANGWPVDTYRDPAHPLQLAIGAHLSRLSGIDLSAGPRGVDGCGLPTLALPLAALARAFAAGTRDPLFVRCQDAMAAHPVLVSGTGRFDTAVLSAAGARLTVKGGAYAVWVGVARPDGPGFAIKLEAGWSEHLPLLACALLGHLGLVPGADGDLAPFADGAVRNRAGEIVGEVRVAHPALLR